MFEALVVLLFSAIAALLPVFVDKILNSITDRREELYLKEDVRRLSEMARTLNSPDTFVKYAKVKREIESKRTRLEKIQEERTTSRIVIYSQRASFFVKYVLPVGPILFWWSTPMFLLPNVSTSDFTFPEEVSVFWWSILCTTVCHRVASIISNF